MIVCSQCGAQCTKNLKLKKNTKKFIDPNCNLNIPEEFKNYINRFELVSSSKQEVEELQADVVDQSDFCCWADIRTDFKEFDL